MMAGTKLGGQKAREKNLARDPDFYAKIGKIGGRNSSGYTFGHGKVDPSKAGQKGGKVSKRGPAK